MPIFRRREPPRSGLGGDGVPLSADVAARRFRALNAAADYVNTIERGDPLWSGSGLDQRTRALTDVFGPASDEDLRDFVIVVCALTWEFISRNNFSLEDISLVMGLPADAALYDERHLPGAFATYILAEYPEGESPILKGAPHDALTECLAWFATMLKRFEMANRIPPLPRP
jgi:hypothetical protein